jgi:hypothetical protein
MGTERPGPAKPWHCKGEDSMQRAQPHELVSAGSTMRGRGWQSLFLRLEAQAQGAGPGLRSYRTEEGLQTLRED